MTPNQKRIVLNPEHVPQAEEILKETGISSLSQLFSIFLSCYGEHLLKSLKPPTDKC